MTFCTESGKRTYDADRQGVSLAPLLFSFVYELYIISNSDIIVIILFPVLDVNYSSANVNLFWGHLVVEELVRNGITLFCLSPGSRSTPLAAAAAVHKSARVKICLDERGAAFFALGYARGNKQPAALICTSGTAAANYLPAVIEAYQSKIPLIVLTADRPPELRDTGANQTIDQIKIYGKYVNWFFDFPCPDESINPAYILSSVDQAVVKAISEPAGPVHLNFMFREPLAPESHSIQKNYYSGISSWKKKNTPFTSYAVAKVSTESKAISDLAQKIKKTNNGLILAGQLRSTHQAKYIVQLAEYLNWPVWADVLSGIDRNYQEKHLINFFDNLLLNATFKTLIQPDMVIQFGRPLTSKRLVQYIKAQKSSSYVVIEETADRLDPEHLVTDRLYGNPQQLTDVILKGKRTRRYSDKLKKMKKFDAAVFSEISALSADGLSEITVAHLISDLCPGKTGLFLGSSMPIRDMDMYGSFRQKNIIIRANRGASGIDGTIASATGFAENIQKTVTVVLGDLAALHDLNSLRLISDSAYPIIIVVVNNDGGGIFSFLPISKFSDIFVKYFATPHGLNFKFAAEMFGLDYHTPRSADEFSTVYKNVLQGKKSVILEIQSDKQSNFQLHQEIQRKISRIKH